MSDARQTLLNLNVNGAVVSMLVERVRAGEIEVLLQTLR